MAENGAQWFVMQRGAGPGSVAPITAAPRAVVSGTAEASGLCGVLDSPERRRVSLSVHGAPPVAAATQPLASAIKENVVPAQPALPLAMPLGVAESTKKRPRRDEQQLQSDPADAAASAQLRVAELESQLAAERSARAAEAAAASEAAERAAQQVEKLRRLYFSALCIAIKLDRSSRSKRSKDGVLLETGALNRDSQQLFEVARLEGVALEAFPSWIAGRLSPQ